MDSGTVSTPLQDNKSPQQSPADDDVPSAKCLMAIRLATFLVLVIVPGLVFTNCLKLSGSTKTDDLVTYGDKLGFTSRYLMLGAFSFILAIGYLEWARYTTGAYHPMMGLDSTPKMQAAKSILLNTCEQLIFTIITRVTVIDYLSADHVMKAIPLINYLFVIGRATFILGYPHKRGFGFQLTAVPSLIAFSYSFVSFICKQMF